MKDKYSSKDKDFHEETWNKVIQQRKYNVIYKDQRHRINVTDRFTSSGYEYGYAVINGVKYQVRKSGLDTWETVVE